VCVCVCVCASDGHKSKSTGLHTHHMPSGRQHTHTPLCTIARARTRPSHARHTRARTASSAGRTASCAPRRCAASAARPSQRPRGHLARVLQRPVPCGGRLSLWWRRQPLCGLAVGRRQHRAQHDRCAVARWRGCCTACVRAHCWAAALHGTQQRQHPHSNRGLQAGARSTPTRTSMHTP
jgi:hypothetical protein